MVVGFNHNIRYRGDVFHIQTEDGGIKNPFITTLLYRGGTIIASKKTGYSDIIKVEMLEKVVEELMQEQHKEMLRRLKSGEFDERAFPGGLPPAENQQPHEPPPPGGGDEPENDSRQTLDEIILDYLTSDGNT
jgi:hypothetical protein